MASKKGSRNDLNAPLRSLSDRLRLLQREAGQILEAVRNDPPADEREARPVGSRVDLAAGLEAQLDRVATNLLERWDIPTRAEISEIQRRLEEIEAAIASPPKPKRTAKTAKKVARTSKSRRTRGTTKHS